MAPAKAASNLSHRDLALRALGESRVQRLRARSEKIKRHLDSTRGANDARAMFFLLHQVEVEYNDLLKRSDCVKRGMKPKDGYHGG